MDAPAFRRISPSCIEIPPHGGMRVPGRVYASPALLETQKADEALRQVVNVAHLPGIVKASLAMPDFHWGYGFPIGGVAAMDVNDGVVSPGGVGYDINCGVRVMSTRLRVDEVRPKRRDALRALARDVPTGVGSSGAIERLSRAELEDLVTRGAAWAVGRGYGRPGDLDAIEDGGRYPGADPAAVSERAFKRGADQVGTLGSGNHFLEIDVVDEVFLPAIAARMGLEAGGVAVSLHTGSRGFGYQVCEDSLRRMQQAVVTYGIDLPDRQLACAPVASPEGKAYLAAMACAANYAWANRQVIMALVETSLARFFGRTPEQLGMRLIYDVCHNIAKIETHDVDAERPRRPEVPEAWRDVGQPVFIPGDMGRYSYVLVGAEGAMRETFGSACHGAGRVASRSAMIQSRRRSNPFREMEERWGVFVLAAGAASAAEEMPDAYKDVAAVVETCEAAGLARRVARLRPLACMKG
jgi:tRNA-splicing ligase RtcB